MAGIKGPHRRGRTREEKDIFAAAYIERQLDLCSKGELTLRPDQLEAMKVRYSRLRPVLSAVEQTTVDPDARRTPEQLLEELRPLLLAHPEYLRALGFAPITPVAAAHTASNAVQADSDTKAA